MIKQKEYLKRRNRLIKKLKQNSIVILHSAEKKRRSHDTYYPYRQDSNFYYLTGFKEDSAKLVLIKKKDYTKTILFIKDKNKQDELWNGKRLGIVKAKSEFLIDEIYSIDDFNTKLAEYQKDIKNYYYDFQSDSFVEIKQSKKKIDITNIIVNYRF